MIIPMIFACACAGERESNRSDASVGGWSADVVSRPAGPAPGFPSREPALDVLSGFQSPPPGYGEVPFWWWTGDPLDKNRLLWQIEELHSKGISGVQVNYAHQDTPGWPTYPAEPEIFSEDWWKMWKFAAEECRKRGMGIGLSGYTIDWPKGDNLFNKIIYSDPGILGREISKSEPHRLSFGDKASLALPPDTIGVWAYPVVGGALRPGGMDLMRYVKDGRLDWKAPEGTWEIWMFSAPRKLGTLNPIHPLAGKTVVEKFFEPFEQAAGDEAGILNYFFQDELQFGVGDVVWADDFREEFRKRKGYDVFEMLPAMFGDIGPATAKARLDFMDVKVALSEERYFIPVFNWHWRKGRIYGCDPEGRGLEPGKYGDNFRIQRWYTAPGHDTPGGRADLIKGKVSSSIAALYRRPRVWLEGYHSLGWGAAPERLMYASCENFLYGCNLLNLHGLYYTTHGSFWEWAPPCYHFRMPYWDHLAAFLRYFERLSYLLSQGTLRADVAIMYPVSPAQAGMDGEAAAAAAFDSGRELFGRGYDFIYMDDQSLDRAMIKDGALEVSDMKFRVLVLPALKAIRWTTIQKAAEFKRQGGIVINVGALPEASDRAGSEDPELGRLIKELFGEVAGDARGMARGVGEAADVGKEEEGGKAAGVAGKTGSEKMGVGAAGVEKSAIEREGAAAKIIGERGEENGEEDREDKDIAIIAAKIANMSAAGGIGLAVKSPKDLVHLISDLIPRDVESDPPVRAMHRKIGFRDVYMVMDAPQGAQCVFRAKGIAELWDPWTGKNFPLDDAVETETGTRVRMPLDRDQAQIIVFTPQEKMGEGASGFDGVKSRKDGSRDKGVLGTGLGKEGSGGKDSEAVKTVAANLAGGKNEEGRLFGGRKVTADMVAADIGNAQENRLSLVDRAFEMTPAETIALAGDWDFELKPTMDNRWGDFRLPVTERMIGAEARIFRYAEEKGQADGLAGKWEAARFDDSAWPRVTNGYGPKFLKLGPLPADSDSAAIDKLLDAGPIDPARPVKIGGKSYSWTSYDFSWRWGKEGDPGHQGFHGLKEKVTDEFICLGRPAEGMNEILYQREEGGSRYYLWTNAYADEACEVSAEIGGLAPAAVYLGGKPVEGLRTGFRLEPGANPLLLRYDSPGRGYFVLLKKDEGKGANTGAEAEISANKAIEVGKKERTPLSMRWFDEPGLIRFDVRGSEQAPAGWYRFVAPPGLKKMVVRANGDIRVWVDGRETTVTEIAAAQRGRAAQSIGDRRNLQVGLRKSAGANAPADKNTPAGTNTPAVRDEAFWRASDADAEGGLKSARTRRFEIDLRLVPAHKSTVAIRLAQNRGDYGGAGFPEPILLECGPGLSEAGDWSDGSVLENYSGGAWYRKTVRLRPDQAGAGVLLDLGDVTATAEIRVNGKPAAILVCPPWKVDLTGQVKAGQNRIEILVYNTLANHFLTIPTRYKGETLRSGLLGPVRLSFYRIT